MMIIDVRKLIHTRAFSGRLHFEIAADDGLVTLPLVKMVSPITAEGDYELFDDDSLEIRGKVRFTLRGACSRCLKEPEKVVEADWNPLFTKGESDGESYAYENGTISLDGSVREAVLLGMPFVLLCDESCPGAEWQ